MKKQSKSPANLPVKFSIVAAVTVILLSFLQWKNSSDEGKINLPRGLVVQVLAHMTPSPGHHIKVKPLGGKEEWDYVCGPNDASVAIIEAKNPVDGTVIVPYIRSAIDSDNNAYLVQSMPVGGVSAIVLKRGFRTKPKEVSVTLSDTFHGQGNIVLLKLSAIKEPELLVPKPTVEETLSFLGEATARWNSGTGLVDIQLRTQLLQDESERVTTLATSYYTPEPDEVSLPSFYGTAVEAVKVKIDRIKTEKSTYTLTYRNAELAKSNGDPFLLANKEQVVGAIHGHKIVLLNTLPRQSKNRLSHSLLVTQPLTFKWASDRQGGGARTPPSGPPSILNVDTFFPSPESLGIDVLKVDLPSENIDGQKIGFSGVFSSTRKHSSPPFGKVPVIRLQVTESRSHLIGSKTIILPVVH